MEKNDPLYERTASTESRTNVDMIRSQLHETPESNLLYFKHEIPVTSTDLSKYDEKCRVAKWCFTVTDHRVIFQTTANTYVQSIYRCDTTVGSEPKLRGFPDCTLWDWNWIPDRKVHAPKKCAGFPYLKTMDELDYSRFEHMDEAFIHELASCDFVSKRQNIVMIGNPGTGKDTSFHCAWGKACMQGMNVKFYTAANLSNELDRSTR